jgi:K+-sensing histidine kinase KdpD
VHGEETVMISGDTSLIVQALVNLIENAARYSRPGGEINVAARQTDAKVESSIEDEARG